MTPEELDSAKKALLDMRREVLKEVQEAMAEYRELGGEALPDISDISANANSRDVLLNLGQNQRTKLRDIETALERIAQGEYGTCMRCEEEIAAQRLKVRPFSRYCIECKTEIEKYGE